MDKDAKFEDVFVSVAPDDDCSIFFTSGTQGFPKGNLQSNSNFFNFKLLGVVHTHKSLVATSRIFTKKYCRTVERGKFI